MKELKNLKRVAQEELEKLDAQYANKNEFTAADAEMYKCLTMALEKQMRIEQIETELGIYGEGVDGMSGRRGRGNDGRYMSMTGGYSYADGYSRGYADGTHQSGGIPPYRPW